MNPKTANLWKFAFMGGVLLTLGIGLTLIGEVEGHAGHSILRSEDPILFWIYVGTLLGVGGGFGCWAAVGIFLTKKGRKPND